MNELNWFWIALALTVPTLVSGLVAFPIWSKGQPISATIIGTCSVSSVNDERLRLRVEKTTTG